MKKILHSLCLLLMILALMPVTNTAMAATDRIHDKAKLLSSSELSSLNDMIQSAEASTDIEIYILTHDNSRSAAPERYIEDFADALGSGNQVIFLYDKYRGEIFIQGYETAEIYIHSKRIDKILDAMTDDLRSGNYVDAFTTYINMVLEYMNDDSDLNYDHNYNQSSPSKGSNNSSNHSNNFYNNDYDDQYYKSENTVDSLLANPLFQIVASLIIGAIGIAIMIGNTKAKMTTNGNHYMDPSRSKLIGRRDQYLRTTVTRVRKPQNNNSGGGGFNSSGHRGGVSSGGRSHSSGGRKL